MPRCGAMPPKFVGRAGAEGAAWRARQTQYGRIQDLLRRPAKKARVDDVEDVDVPLELTTQDDEDDANGDVTLDPAARPQKRARRRPESIQRSESNQRFSALGPDIQALALELQRRAEEASDAEDATEVRVLLGRQSVNFMA